MKSLLKNVGYSLIKTLASLIFPLITFSYASHILLTDGMGQIDFSKSYVAFFNMIGMLGVVNYGTREGSRIRYDKQKLSTLAQELLILNTLSITFSYVVFFTSIHMIKKLQSYTCLLSIFSVSIVLAAVGMEWLYNAVEDYSYMAWRTCILQVMSLILMFCFVRKQEDVWKYAIIQVMAASGNNIMNLFHSRRYISYKKSQKYNLKRHAKPIFIIFCMTLSVQVFTHMDSTMLGFISGNREVGLYSAASKISGLSSALITAMTLVLMPRIAFYTNQNRTEEIERLSDYAINYIMLLGIPASIGLCSVSKNVIEIFSGFAFLNADLTTKIMAFRVLLVPLNSFIAIHLFISLGKERNTLIATLVAAILNFALNMILIPKYAQNGAAIATVMAEGIEMAVNLMFLSKIMNLKKLFRKIWQYLVASIPIVVISHICFSFIKDSYLCFGSTIVLSTCVYFTVLFLMKNEYLKGGIDVIKRKAG